MEEPKNRVRTCNVRVRMRQLTANLSTSFWDGSWSHILSPRLSFLRLLNSSPPRQPWPRTSSRGNRRAGPGNRAGSRRGPEAAKEEAAPGAAMAEGRGSSRLYSLSLISLGLRLTASLPGKLQSSRAGAGSSAPARPDHPRREIGRAHV